MSEKNSNNFDLEEIKSEFERIKQESDQIEIDIEKIKDSIKRGARRSDHRFSISENSAASETPVQRPEPLK